MNRSRLSMSVRVGLAVLAALLALPFSTGTASAQGQYSVYIAPTGLVDRGTATVSGAVLLPEEDFQDLVAVFVQV